MVMVAGALTPVRMAPNVAVAPPLKLSAPVPLVAMKTSFVLANVPVPVRARLPPLSIERVEETAPADAMAADFPVSIETSLVDVGTALPVQLVASNQSVLELWV